MVVWYIGHALVLENKNEAMDFSLAACEIIWFVKNIELSLQVSWVDNLF